MNQPAKDAAGAPSWGASRRGFLGLALGASAAGLLSACSGGSGSGGSDTIKILNTSSTGSITLNKLMASEKFFEKVGVKASISNLNSGNQVLAGLVSGAADITIFSGLIGVFPGIEQGMNLKVLGGTQITSSSALFSGDPQIQTVRDLKGKSLGAGAVGSQIYDAFAAILAKYDIARTDVTFRNIGSSAESMKAALAKQVDCGYGEVGDQPLATKDGVRMITTVSEELPLWINGGAVASPSTISAKRESLVKVMAAYVNLFKFMATPESKAPYVAAYASSGGTQAGGEAEWEFLYKVTSYSATLDLPTDKVDYIQQLNVSAGTQKKVLAYDSYTDLSLRKEAVALAG